MRWGYSVNPEKRADGKWHLRMTVTFNRKKVSFKPGITVEIKKWNKEAQRSKPNVTHGDKKVPANYINRTIQKYIDTAESIFQEYEEDKIIPTPDRFKRDFNARLLRTPSDSVNIIALLDAFVAEQSSLNQWADGTIKRFGVVRNKLSRFSPTAEIMDIDERWLTDFVTYLIYTEGLSNSTVQDNIKRIKWFLKWADAKGERVPSDYRQFAPRLKTVKRPVIFLTWDELMKVYNADLPTEYLKRTRDVFCLCCFTSLRYSDVHALKPENIKDDCIEIVTQKTSDPLRIDLNDYSRAILKKYNNNIPKISNEKMNDYIKEVGMMCGLDTPVTIVTYRGGKREEVTQPKWRLLSTHAGRRTFISNALSLGIPVDVVMKWTGHSDYSAMKPYIEIADDVKKNAMKLFNAPKMPPND